MSNSYRLVLRNTATSKTSKSLVLADCFYLAYILAEVKAKDTKSVIVSLEERNWKNEQNN